MQSIRPKWCELIAQGKKTIEVRKTRPRCDTPFKVDIYCTNDRKIMLERSNYDKSIYLNSNIYYPHKMGCSLNGKVIGEYICDEVLEYPYIDDGYSSGGDYLTITREEYIKMCLDHAGLLTYGDGKTLYGWHISDLQIYGTPRALSDFQLACNHKEDCCTCKRWSGKEFACIGGLKRAPQSWCYVQRIWE